MYSKDDLVSKYTDLSDHELCEIYKNIDEYADEAKVALNIVINKRGGIEKLLMLQEEKKARIKETERIKLEVIKQIGADEAFPILKKNITSTILTREEISEVIENALKEIEKDRDDKKIKPRTIAGSILGGSIASIIGGILWGLQMMYSNAMFMILLTALVLFCYGIIKISTRQSNKNIVVLIATIISVILALLLGEMLYGIFGYLGGELKY